MALPKHTYLEFLIAARRDADVSWPLIFFSKAGIPASSVVAKEFKTKICWTYYARSRAEIKKLSQLFSQFKQKGWKASVRKLGERDWLLRWQDYFHTMPLGKRFTIVPANRGTQYLIRKTKELSIVSPERPGISLRHLPGFLREFKSKEFRLVNTLRGRSWAGLVYKKT